MIDAIWAGLMLISIIFGLLNGRAQEVTDALFAGAAQTAELGLILFGTMAFFSGLMRIADKSGFTALLARLFSPLLRLLFPRLDPRGPAGRAITMNMSANLLGLGNAATPFGLEAMAHLDRDNPRSGCATDHMVTFVVINTASLQLIPASVAAIRAAHGAKSPMDIMPAVWLASVCSLAAGVLVARLLSAGGGALRRPPEKPK